MDVTLKADNVLEELRKAPDKLLEAFRAAVFIVAQDVMDRAVEDAPKLSGQLRASRFVSRTWPVQAGFSAPYAAAVHELPAAHTSGRSKYLAANLVPPGYESALAAAVARCAQDGTTLATAPARHPTKGNPGRRARRPARRKARR